MALFHNRFYILYLQKSDSECFFHFIYIIQLFPGKQLYFADCRLWVIAGYKRFGNRFRLTSHMTVRGCFQIDRVTRFRRSSMGFRALIEKIPDLFSDSPSVIFTFARPKVFTKMFIGLATPIA